VFCIKLYKVGGISAARQIAAIAAASGLQVNCGGLAVTSQFEAAASAHFCASVPLKQTFGAAEFAFGLETVGRDPLAAANDFRIRNGAVQVPTGPGLGIVLDEDALAHHTLKKVVVT
jgi:L-alanine-DL-glutamate epimerase-like enolase superfamily enzyme